MLKPKKPSLFLKNSKKGQAMIEFLPAIILFFVVIAASVVFFIGLRESSRMQEAARNAAFAKIRNSGPLVMQAGANKVGMAGHYTFGIQVAANPAITNAGTCFSVRPQNNVIQTTLPTILGIGLNLERAHRVTVFRRPGAVNSCE